MPSALAQIGLIVAASAMASGQVADLDLWEPGDRKIAQLEMVVILQALVGRPQRFRGRRGVWFIDNLCRCSHDVHTWTE